MFAAQADGGGERAPHLAAESREGSDLLVAKEFGHLLRGPFPARQHLPEVKIAGQALEAPVVLLHDAAALGTGMVHGGEGGVRNLAVLDALHQLPGHGLDMLHELLARQTALLHLL